MAAFSDDFNRPDSSDLGSNWVEVSGDWSIIGGQLAPDASSGNTIVRASTAMASSDHSAQFTIAATAAASQGVWCRGDSTLSNGYLWRTNGSSWDLFAVVGGSFTGIGTYTAPVAPGDVAKVQAVGNVIKGYVNGIERVSVANTAVATGTSVGLRIMALPGLRFDDFAAGDITTGTTIALTPATSIEAAPPLTGAKTAAMAAATETDAGQALIGAKTAATAVATEQAAAQALTATKTAALPSAIETDGVTALAGIKTGALVVAGSAEVAQALTAATILTAAATVETAQPVTGVKTAVLAPAVEVCAARPLTQPSAHTPSPERTIRIPAEQRRLVVPAESRTLTVR